MKEEHGSGYNKTARKEVVEITFIIGQNVELEKFTVTRISLNPFSRNLHCRC